MNFLQSSTALSISAILFPLIIICYWLGNLYHKRAVIKYPDQINTDTGTIISALLALLGLMLAFSFGMSNSRFDTRRQLIIEEANDIGTAILRTEIFPDSIRNLLKADFKNYVEARIEYYQVGMDHEKILALKAKSDSISKNIWMIAADYAKVDNITVLTSEFIPAMNAVIDITTSRRAASEATIPDSILYFLLILCLGSSFLLGYDNKSRIDWIVVLGFAVLLSATIYTIIDLDRPRSGLINMDLPNQKIIDLRKMFIQE